MRCLLLIILLFPCLSAFPQTSATDSINTIETVFDKDFELKDGYHIGALVIQIPQEIALKCDKKKIRIANKPWTPPEEKWGPKGSASVTQCDCETIYMVTEKGDTLEKKIYRSSYTKVYHISLWDEKKKEWEVVYKP